MEQPYIVIITIISLLLTILHSYQNPTLLYSESRCNPQNNNCVACPHLELNTQAYPLNKYTRVSHNNQFQILSTYNYRINKAQCRDMLAIIQKNQEGTWGLTDQTVAQIQNRTFSFEKAQEVTVATGKEYNLIISGVEDYLIFYQGSDPKSPLIYIQNEANPQKLMKLSRAISWGMFLALLLKYFDTGIGIFNKEKVYPFPMLQILTLSYIIYISYQISSFSFIYVAQLMYLTYLVINLGKKLNILKLFCSFILFFILGESFTFIANIIWLLYMKKINPNLLKQNLKLKIATIIVILSLIANVLLVIGKFNYFVYANYAYKIISIPVSFLLFQIQEVVQKRLMVRVISLDRYVEQ